MTEPIEAIIKFPDGVTDDSALVTHLGGNRYRLELEPAAFFLDNERDESGLPRYGDTIEAVRTRSGSLKFRKVIERSGLRRFTYAVSRDFVDSEAFPKMLEKVELHDGHWEQVFGGLLLIYLPEDCGYDPGEDLVQPSGSLGVDPRVKPEGDT